jgi:hypothetical protein
MVAELTKRYRGVPCFRCGEPISVSAKVASLRSEIESRDTNAPHAFTVRCRLRAYETVYTIAEANLKSVRRGTLSARRRQFGGLEEQQP